MEEVELQRRKCELEKIDGKLKQKIADLVNEYSLSGILGGVDGFFHKTFSVLDFGPLNRDELGDIAPAMGYPADFKYLARQKIEELVKVYSVKFIGTVWIDGPGLQPYFGIFATKDITQENLDGIKIGLQKILNWYNRLLNSRYGSDSD